MSKIKIFAGTSNPSLTAQICDNLGAPQGQIQISRFKSGEIYVRYLEPLRTCDVFIVQSLSHPVNDHLIELLVMIDAAKRASAKTINVLIPYFGYARQLQKVAPRDPISAKMVADVLTSVGANRVITMDLHADAIQGFFKIPVDHLTTLDLITKHLLGANIPNPVVVSPDAGRAKIAEKLAESLDAPFAIMLKERREDRPPEESHVIGDVRGRTPIVIEDIIDTGRTVLDAVAALKRQGANEAYVCVAHGLFSDSALDKLHQAHIQEIVVTNTIQQSPERHPKLRVLSASQLLATAIRIIYEGGSIDTLLHNPR
ncbi:ribose-phosphate diphosphokinase [Paenibacillus xanthanilyticus]|uniref:Ribose-phosphate diphosphokinase n=1 Tax=Paenibacillus xanthanilyticus TaxID=1783531 RepID=A0ABV8K9J4_9BACL